MIVRHRLLKGTENTEKGDDDGGDRYDTKLLGRYQPG